MRAKIIKALPINIYKFRDFDGNSSLQNAIIKNKISEEDIDFFVACGGDINNVNDSGYTALHLAIEKKCSIEIINKLIQHKADPNISNKVGSSPLHRAASYCNSIIVTALLNAGANPNALSNQNDEQTPLHCAVRRTNPDIEVVKALLNDLRTNPNVCKDNQITPLGIAVKKDLFEIAKLLLENRAKPGEEKGENSSLHLAVQFDKPEMVKIILEARADPNSNFFEFPPMSTITAAAQYDSFAIVKLLLDYGARASTLQVSSNICDTSGNVLLSFPYTPNQEPMFWAKYHKNEAMINALEERGAPNRDLTNQEQRLGNSNLTPWAQDIIKKRREATALQLTNTSVSYS